MVCFFLEKEKQKENEGWMNQDEVYMTNLNMVIEKNTKLKAKSLKILYCINMCMGFIISFNFLLCQT